MGFFPREDLIMSHAALHEHALRINSMCLLGQEGQQLPSDTTASAASQFSIGQLVDTSLHTTEPSYNEMKKHSEVNNMGQSLHHYGRIWRGKLAIGSWGSLCMHTENVVSNLTTEKVWGLLSHKNMVFTLLHHTCVSKQYVRCRCTRCSRGW